MYKSLRTLAFALCVVPSGFSASILISGNSMTSSNTTFTNNLAKLSGNTYTFVTSQNLPATSLAGYSLVWLDGFSQFVDLSSLTDYVNAGGHVLVQNPGFGSEPLSAYPDGAGLNASFTAPDFEPSVRILEPGDFVNAGLTDVG